MRRAVALVIAAAALAGGVAALVSPSSATTATRCRHLGIPGTIGYENCTYLPVDPEDLIR